MYSEVNALEQQLSDAKLLVERRQMAMRLEKNRDFKKLILDEFCRRVRPLCTGVGQSCSDR